MSDLLTPAELAAIAEREAKATKGPWKRDPYNFPNMQVIAHGNEVVSCHRAHNRQASERVVPNHEFIAHARTDIPALLAHIAALEARTPAPATDGTECICGKCEACKSKLSAWDARRNSNKTPCPAADDTTVRIGENDYKDFVACEESPAPYNEHIVTPDNPELDGTDFAHPAWWRGHHQTTEMFCHHVQAILDGRDVKDESVSPEPWHTVRKRLLALVEKPAPAHFQCAECKPWLDAEKPAPATDVDALLAEAEEQLKAWKYNGHLDDWRGAEMALCAVISRLATALRESRAREVAAEKKYQRLFEPWDEVNGWCEHNHQFSYRLDDEDNSDGCMQCERDAAIARAEKAEAEAKEANSTLDMYAKAWWRELKGPYCNKRHEIDALVLTTRERITERDALTADLAAARAELGALGPVEYEWRATDSHYWDACPHCNGKKNCGRVGKHRAIRVVKEAQ